MRQVGSSNHSRWEFEYHVVFIPQYRKKAIFGQIRQDWVDVMHRLAQQNDWRQPLLPAPDNYFCHCGAALFWWRERDGAAGSLLYGIAAMSSVMAVLGMLGLRVPPRWIPCGRSQSEQPSATGLALSLIGGDQRVHVEVAA